jgi:kynureninase
MVDSSTFGRAHADAIDRDAQDPLAPLRERFVLPGDGRLYFVGNSLGLLPRATIDALRCAVEQEWGGHAIDGWNRSGWWDMALRLGGLLAPIVGAGQDELLVTDSTTLNAYKLLGAVLQAEPRRDTIILERSNFPSNAHLVEGMTELMASAGRRLRTRLIDVEQEAVPVPSQLAEAMAGEDGERAIALLSHVAFRSGFRFDLAAVNRAAREAGSRVIWDFSHAVGVVEIDARRHGVELGVGCSYKYLNGGPGAPAWLMIATHLIEGLSNPLRGWVGHRRPFAMELGYEPAPGIARFRCGTCPVLSMRALEPAYSLTAEAGIGAIWEKASGQWDFASSLVAEHLAPLGVEVATPPHRHGAHLTLRHPRAMDWKRALAARRVVVDFRPPDLIRVAIQPLNTRWIDLVDFVNRAMEALSPEALAEAKAEAAAASEGIVT